MCKLGVDGWVCQVWMDGYVKYEVGGWVCKVWVSVFRSMEC